MHHIPANLQFAIEWCNQPDVHRALMATLHDSNLVQDMSRPLVLFALCLSAAQPGCWWGPKTLQNTRTHYNRAVQTTAREEMLLNLVRMKYRDSIEFIKIPSITGQHTYAGGVGLSFPFSSARGSGSTDFAAQSKPTIVYQPEQASEFNRRLLAPIDIVTLDLLSSKGWAINRVLRMTVRSINDLDNATSAGGPTPDSKPEFEAFRHVANQLRELQQDRYIELGNESLTLDSPVSVSAPIDAELVKGESLVEAAMNGYRFEREDDGRMGLWTVPKASTTLVLRVAPVARSSPEMYDIVELLELEPDHDYYPIKADSFGQLKTPATWRSNPDQHSSPLRQELVVSTRSFKEIMFYLSHGIEVPDSHVSGGLITKTHDECGQEFDWRSMTGDLLQVKVAKLPPLRAAVSVFYRGHWFYVEDRDLNSKATFNLLIELFNLEIRAGGGAQIPLLSI
jgi:hypothetical protein